jgi:hypothetical protein
MTSLSTIASPAPQTGSHLPYNDTALANVQSVAGDSAAVQFQAYEGEAQDRSRMPASLGSPAEKAIPTDTVASGRAPAPATPAPTKTKAQQRMKREPVAGVPRQMDLGPMLFHTFLLSPMNKFERADVVKNALMEWNTTGPSERARQRLESLMLHPDAARNVAGNWIAQIPAAAWNPSQRGTDLIDALMLHLMDTGVHGELVQGYIQALKSAGLYDSVVAGLQRDHPGKTKEWAEEMVVKILSTWDGPLPADVNLDGYTPGTPYMDMRQKAVFFEELLNPNRPPQYYEKKRSVCREALFRGEPIPERCDIHIADLKETPATTANVATAAPAIDPAVVTMGSAAWLPVDTVN